MLGINLFKGGNRKGATAQRYEDLFMDVREVVEDERIGREEGIVAMIDDVEAHARIALMRARGLAQTNPLEAQRQLQIAQTNLMARNNFESIRHAGAIDITSMLGNIQKLAIMVQDQQQMIAASLTPQAIAIETPPRPREASKTREVPKGPPAAGAKPSGRFDREDEEFYRKAPENGTR